MSSRDAALEVATEEYRQAITRAMRICAEADHSIDTGRVTHHHAHNLAGAVSEIAMLAGQIELLRAITDLTP